MPTLTTPAQLISAIPLMLGYQPQDSAVIVLTLDDAIVMLVRIDLPEPGGTDWASGTAHSLSQAFPEPARALVAVYPGEHRAPTDPYLAELTEQISGLGHDVSESVWVTERTWRCVNCANDHCPDTGHDLTNADEAAARALVGDHAVAASREDLEREIAPDTSEFAALVAADLAAQPDLTEERRDEIIAIAQAMSSNAPATPADYAALITGLADIRVRDTILWDAGQLSLEQKQHLSEHVRIACTCAPDGRRAPIATVRAILAYVCGDGTRANIAIEQALADDPSYSLAQLMGKALSIGLHPQVWLDGLVGMSREDCRRPVTSP